MTPTETTTLLRQFNAWRRDLDDKFEQPDTREISEAIDAAVEMIERLERLKAEIRDRNDLITRLQNELRGYREREKTMGWQE